MLRIQTRRAVGPFTQAVSNTDFDFTFPVPEGEFGALMCARATVLCSAIVVGRNFGVRVQRGRTAEDDDSGYQSQNVLNLVANGEFDMQWGIAATGLAAGFQLSMTNPLVKVVMDRPFQVKFVSVLDATDVISGLEVVWVTGTLAEVLNAL